MNYMLWGLVAILLAVSVFKDRMKTRRAMMMAFNQFKGLLPILVAIVLFLGEVRALLDPTLIGRLIGPESGVLGVIGGLAVGSVMFLPGFVAFPLAAGFLKIGAGYPQVAGFIASLMGVGVSTAPIEVKFFGLKLTILRNILCLVMAVVFVMVIWGVGL